MDRSVGVRVGTRVSLVLHPLIPICSGLHLLRRWGYGPEESVVGL